MAVSTWRAQRNEKARVRLMRNLPEVFPAAVLVHALSRPFLPATPRRTVDSYWRHHPVRADKLARALAALSGAPEGWVWRVGIQKAIAARHGAGNTANSAKSEIWLGDLDSNQD
jgi:hypothetical protein